MDFFDTGGKKISAEIVDTINSLKDKQVFIDYLVSLSLQDNLNNPKPEQTSQE